MLLTFILTASVAAIALGASISQESSNGDDFRCGSEPGEEYRNISKKFAIDEAVARSQGQRSIQQIKVDVYMHVVAANPDNAKQESISDGVLIHQLDIINKDFAPSGISFSLKSIDRIYNTTWSRNKDPRTMKEKLRKGSKSDLNLYFIPKMNVYGYCSFPWSFENITDDRHQDGCVIRSDTLPGGASANFNLGKTAVHEVGHWLGLLHTFQGNGCKSDGDEIDDTPRQAGPSKGCPIGRDSCPEYEGLDPIHNFMDYSQDSCYTHFTPGQTQRMINMWNKFRA